MKLDKFSVAIAVGLVFTIIIVAVLATTFEYPILESEFLGIVLWFFYSLGKIIGFMESPKEKGANSK